jgi:hypothetical protein
VVPPLLVDPRGTRRVRVLANFGMNFAGNGGGNLDEAVPK